MGGGGAKTRRRKQRGRQRRKISCLYFLLVPKDTLLECPHFSGHRDGMKGNQQNRGRSGSSEEKGRRTGGRGWGFGSEA